MYLCPGGDTCIFSDGATAALLRGSRREKAGHEQYKQTHTVHTYVQ